METDRNGEATDEALRAQELRAQAGALLAQADRLEASEAFTGRLGECGHCGHTSTEHFAAPCETPGAECAECEAEGREFPCWDFDL